MSNSDKKRKMSIVKGMLLIGALGAGVVGATQLAQAIKGSAFLANSVYLTALNATPGVVVDTDPVSTYIGMQGTECTATGGVATYDTCLVASAYNSTASTRGLKTGSGWVKWLILDVLANPNESRIDCTKVSAANTATGGTLIFANVTATGTSLLWSSGALLGPTDYIKCGILNTQGTGTSLRIRGEMTYSHITQ